MRTIYFNGQVIGELPNTGDEALDLAAARKMLRDSGLSRDITEAQAYLGQARSFAATALHLFGKDLSKAPRNGLSVAPFVVNSAFSAEVYLKTLHLVDGRKERGHELLPLYDGLSKEVKCALFESALQSAPRLGLSCSSEEEFRAYVSEMSNAFVSWRYRHESGSAPRVGIQSIVLVLKVLDEQAAARVAA
jgi:hypothetical protein